MGQNANTAASDTSPVAAFESSPSSAEDALRSADALMYEAKRSGGRRVKVARVQAGAILESALAAVSS